MPLFFHLVTMSPCLIVTVQLPFYLEGAPGIGKTEVVKQIANELGIGFVSFSITHHTRNSLIGLPASATSRRQRLTAAQD